MSACLELYIVFLQIGLFSIGGGYAALPMVQEQIVYNCHWLSMSEYLNLLAIAEMTPGPLALNCASFVGMRQAGFLGACAATCGCITAPCLISLLLAMLFQKYGALPWSQGLLRGVRPAVVGLIASVGVSFTLLSCFGFELKKSPVQQWQFSPVAATIFIVCLLCLRLKKLNPLYVMAIGAGAGLIIYGSGLAKM